MKTTKRILTCALAAFMTATTIWAQKDTPETISGHSEELDMLVDLAELDLISDMLESLLREEENADSSSIADSQTPENGLACMPGMDLGMPGGGFGGFPIMVGFSGMGGFGAMGGFSGYPGGFGCMGGFCGF